VDLYLDLVKAFGTVSHKKLMKVLIQAGVREVLLNWFKSYLQINNTYSNSEDYLCGAPQGKVLGPILFIICIVFSP